MIIRGARPADNFAQISNAALSDTRLSFRARGVLAYLLSRPVGWSTSADGLSEQAKEGRDAIRTALNELVEAGYLVRNRRQTQHGQWVTDVHVTDSPTTGFQASADQPSVDQGVKTKKDTQEEDSLVRPAVRRPRGRVAYTQEFEQFWMTYPRREKKPAAFTAYTRARGRGVMHTDILDGAQRYRDDPNREDAYTRHPATWLNADGWEDAPLPARNGRPTAQSLHDQTMALAASFATPQIGA